jgi:hypothetical protein
VDDSKNLFTITNNGSVANSGTNPFAYVIGGSGLKLYLDATNYTSYPLTGSTWYDVSGNNNNGTIAGTTPYNSGYFTFNGIDSVINSFSNTAVIPTGNTQYTISAWVQIANKTNQGGIAGWGNYGTTNAVNAFRLTNTGLANYWWGNDYAISTGLNTGSTWYMLTATFDGTYRRIYVNGNYVEYPGDYSTGHNVPSSTNLTIGKTNNGNVEWFSGKISQVLILLGCLLHLGNFKTTIPLDYDGTKPMNIESPSISIQKLAELLGLDDNQNLTYFTIQKYMNKHFVKNSDV